MEQFLVHKMTSGLLVICILLSLTACGGGGAQASSTFADTSTFTVSGTVSGHSGFVTLTNNGSDAQMVAEDTTTFRFSALKSGSSWDIAVVAPVGQICAVINPSGTNIIRNITNVKVICSSRLTQQPQEFWRANNEPHKNIHGKDSHV